MQIEKVARPQETGPLKTFDAVILFLFTEL